MPVGRARWSGALVKLNRWGCSPHRWPGSQDSRRLGTRRTRSVARSKLAIGRLDAEIDIRRAVLHRTRPTLVIAMPRRCPCRAERAASYCRRRSCGARFMNAPTRATSSIMVRALRSLHGCDEKIPDRHAPELRTISRSSRRFSLRTSSTRQSTPRRPAMQRGATSSTTMMTCATSRLASAAAAGSRARATEYCDFDSPIRAVRCAWTLSDRIRSELGIEIRAGCTLARSRHGGDVAGMTVIGPHGLLRRCTATPR